MPSGLFGGGPSGSTTTTSINPTQQAQLPFLKGGWQAAADQAQNHPTQYYPGTTLNLDPNLAGGYSNLASVGAHIGGLVDQGNGAYGSAVSGGYGVGNSPAFAGLNSIGYGTDPASASARNYSGAIGQVGGAAADTGLGFGNRISGAANDAPGAVAPAASTLMRNSAEAYANPALRPLSAEANGAFLGSNPFIDREYQAASDPLVRQYMTATAPGTDSNFEAAGRYGSGAHANAQSTNELNLGKSLGDLSSNLYGGDYANERGLMTTAGEALGSNYTGDIGASTNAASAGGNLALGGANTRIGGLGTAAGAANSGFGTAAGAYGTGGGLDLSSIAQRLGALGTEQTGYQAGNTDALQGLALQPSVLGANATPANDQIAAGQGLSGVNQAGITDLTNRFYGNQQAPWQNINQFMNAIGQPTTGSGTVTQPYFTPSLASQGLGLGIGANSLFGSNGAFPGVGSSLASGIGGLFGSAGGAGAGTVDSLAALAGSPSLASLGLEAPSVGGDVLSAFLPFLAAA